MTDGVFKLGKTWKKKVRSHIFLNTTSVSRERNEFNQRVERGSHQQQAIVLCSYVFQTKRGQKGDASSIFIPFLQEADGLGTTSLLLS